MEANLDQANLENAVLSQAYLYRATLMEANLRNAVCHGTNLQLANLAGANLSNADLTGANLKGALLEGTNVDQATLASCSIYGISAWNILGRPKDSTGLVITHEDEPAITVDNIEVAQFIYLLLNNKKIRNVIDTITSKVVLILGRFTHERKQILDSIRIELRKFEYGYVPIVFDFDKPATRDTHESMTALARMARFVIADITDPKSIPQELVSIVEQLPSLPVQPILHQGSEPWGMYDHIRRYPWVLKLRIYDAPEDLLLCLRDTIVAPAEAKVREIRKK